MLDEMMEWFETLVTLWNNSQLDERKEVEEQLINLGAKLVNGVWVYDPEWIE